MRSARRPHIAALASAAAVLVLVSVLVSSCTSTKTGFAIRTAPAGKGPSSDAATTAGPQPAHARPAGEFTISFAGDVHFSGRVRTRLDRDPATAFGQAAPVLRRADLTMVNLETAITSGGVQQNKLFTFRAPPEAFTALRDAGIDVATMANNHGADYGTPGLHDSLAAIRASGFPVIGIGKDAAQAYAPYTATLNGVRVAIIAADQVQDETTLRLFSAGPGKPGVANAYSPELITAVKRAKAAGYVVIVYVHWGIEYQTCPSGDQTSLAHQLAHVGASAVIGTHAHVLQGAGWLPDGTYVEYGLGNYLWWMSFGNNQDDNGVLTLTFRRSKVVAGIFHPSHLDSRGVPVPAKGAERRRIMAEWNADRPCTDLSASARD
ncbi:MAG TPA: CapA family protein [Jatrophihabitans sp.]|nr:CapA family protein [Jatrophihabitans sp.]